MNGFGYRHGSLAVEDCDLAEIVEETGTPSYIYSASVIRNNYRSLTEAFESADMQAPVIAYACKANSNQAVLKLLSRLGAGADIVSGGELVRCLEAGIPAEKIVFSGVSKSDFEIGLAIRSGIRQINIESEYEFGRICDIAGQLEKTANITFRLNPDVDADTHTKISTGRAEDKFGMLFEDIEPLYEKAACMPWINLRGLHVHIGSQITDVSRFAASYERLAQAAKTFLDRGLPLDTLDLGGGLGIVYRYGEDETPDIGEYTRIIRENIKFPGVEKVIEPGRYITGNAGVLVTRLLYIKESGGKKFAVVDAGMNDLIRPALYNAWHDIQPLKERDGVKNVYDIVGPVCESSDTFAFRREITGLQSGDLLAVNSSGAYGAVMASNYNTRPMPPEILVDGDRFAVIRERQTVEDIIGGDIIPGWI